VRAASVRLQPIKCDEVYEQSFIHFYFLPCALAGYLLLRRARFANLFMLLASLHFYGVSAWWYLVRSS
jgi:hypothetical protein